MNTKQNISGERFSQSYVKEFYSSSNSAPLVVSSIVGERLNNSISNFFLLKARKRLWSDLVLMINFDSEGFWKSNVNTLSGEKLIISQTLLRFKATGYLDFNLQSLISKFSINSLLLNLPKYYSSLSLFEKEVLNKWIYSMVSRLNLIFKKYSKSGISKNIAYLNKVFGYEVNSFLNFSKSLFPHIKRFNLGGNAFLL